MEFDQIRKHCERKLEGPGRGTAKGLEGEEVESAYKTIKKSTLISPDAVQRTWFLSPDEEEQEHTRVVISLTLIVAWMPSCWLTVLIDERYKSGPEEVITS